MSAPEITPVPANKFRYYLVNVRTRLVSGTDSLTIAEDVSNLGYFIVLDSIGGEQLQGDGYLEDIPEVDLAGILPLHRLRCPTC